MKQFIEYILIVFFSVVLAVTGFRLYKIWEEYQVAGDEYEKLRLYIEESEKETEDNKQETGSPELFIDFDSLKKINPDIVAWIRIEAVGIDYPIVQGNDNEHYLHYTFAGEANIAGSIFLDYRNKADFTDHKAILYGHNMKNGSMFAALKNLDISNEPVAVVYTPEQTLEYQLVTAEYVLLNDDVYHLEEPEVQIVDDNEDTLRRVLILSTCSNDASRRLVVKGRLS